MKKALLIISVLLVLAAIPITILLVKQQQDIRQRAAPATRMYLEPGNQSVNVNTDDGAFSLNVKLDTEENIVALAQIDVEIDPTYLEIVSLEQSGSFLPNRLARPEPTEDSASLTVGVQAPSTGVQGQNQTIAVLTLRAHTNTPAGSPTEVRLLHPPSLVTGGSLVPLDQNDDKGEDVLVSAESARVTITGGGTSPSPTPTPTASASPTASPRVSPSPSTNPQVTKITAPSNNSTIYNRRPTITGESFPGATLTLTLKRGNTVVINPPPSVTVDAQGNWSYPVTTDLVNGVYSITVVATDPDTDEVETAASVFTVADAPSGGGTASPSPSTSATPSSGQAQPSATTTTVPVTGAATPTIFLLGLAVLLLSLGAGLAFLF